MCLKKICSYKIKLNHSTYIQFFSSVFWSNFAWKTTLITLLLIDKSIYQMWPKHFLANWRLAFTRAIFAPPNDLFLFFMTLGAIMALWLCSPLHNKINQLASKKKHAFIKWSLPISPQQMLYTWNKWPGSVDVVFWIGRDNKEVSSAINVLWRLSFVQILLLNIKSFKSH